MRTYERVMMCKTWETVYKVLLVDEVTGNSYNRFESTDRFTCEVYVDHHKYEIPRDCHFEIVAEE